MTEAASTDRTRESVAREYGQEKWPALKRTIEQERRAEPEAGLARILNRVLTAQYRGRDDREPRRFVLDGTETRMPAGGGFGAAQFILQDHITAALRPETGLVMELGSGWGWHILSTWLGGGPQDAAYVAAEYTEAGREAVTALGELDPRLDLRAIAFDYHEPDLSEAAGHEHAVVYTAHSIEQIPQVRPELVDAIRGVARNVTCLHFEPVGWQVEGEGRVGSSREYAEEHDYNRNLVATLRDAEAAGQIAIEHVHPELFGINPDNSTTVIRWTSVAG